MIPRAAGGVIIREWELAEAGLKDRIPWNRQVKDLQIACASSHYVFLHA